MATGKTTRNHDEIRKWAEARGGKPGHVTSTERPDDPGILRICFPHAPQHNNEAIEEIGWDEFFEKFEEQGLQMVYQEKTADGKLSDFNKLTYPDPDSKEGKALLKKSASKKSSAKSPAKKSESKSASGKSPSKTAAKTSAGKKPEPPARDFPKPEHGHGRSQVY